MAELYAKDAGFAMQALNDVMENGEPAELLIALRQMTKAFGGVQTVAEKAELNPTQLCRTPSAEGNPTLGSLTAVLRAMGLQLMGWEATEESGKGGRLSRTRVIPTLVRLWETRYWWHRFFPYPAIVAMDHTHAMKLNEWSTQMLVRLRVVAGKE